MLVAFGSSEVETEPNGIFRTESGILMTLCPEISPYSTRKSMSGKFSETLFADIDAIWRLLVRFLPFLGSECSLDMSA